MKMNTIRRWLLARAEKAVPSLRLWALQIILEAERRVPGQTGAEKKAYVVKTLDELIRLPWWLEPVDSAIFGALIDLICEKTPLGGINRLLGGLIGLIIGSLTVWVISILTFMVSPEFIEQTRFALWLAKNFPLSLFFGIG